MTFPSAHAPLARIAGWGAERQLVAAADAEPGALLVAEYPIAFAQTHAGEDDVGPWLLLETILSSPEMFEQVSAQDLKLTKWPLAPEDEATLEQVARKYGRNPKKLAQLYHRVATNNIRYSQDGVTGYGIWPILCRANHSCDPNATPRGTPHSPLAELLLATRPIPKDTAICWNYLGDASVLTLDWFGRNARLHRDFQFLCRCRRCEAERPAHVAGLSKTALAAYFEKGAQIGALPLRGRV